MDFNTLGHKLNFFLANTFSEIQKNIQKVDPRPGYFQKVILWDENNGGIVKFIDKWFFVVVISVTCLRRLQTAFLGGIRFLTWCSLLYQQQYLFVFLFCG